MLVLLTMLPFQQNNFGSRNAYFLWYAQRSWIAKSDIHKP